MSPTPAPVQNWKTTILGIIMMALSDQPDNHAHPHAHSAHAGIAPPSLLGSS